MLTPTINWLFQQSRSIKRLISIALDTLFMTVAYWGAIILRLDTGSLLSSPPHWWVLATMVPVTLLCFVRFGLYRAVLRYLGYHATVVMIGGVAVSAVTMVFAAYYFNAFLPRSVPVIYAALALILCGG